LASTIPEALTEATYRSDLRKSYAPWTTQQQNQRPQQPQQQQQQQRQQQQQQLVGPGDFQVVEVRDRSVDTKAAPLPHDLRPDQVLYIDYLQDTNFLNSNDGSFVRLVTPEGLVKMMDAGYDYMKRLDANGLLPLPRVDPTDSDSYPGSPAQAKEAMWGWERERSA
jgi:hypothetical protein